MSFMLCRITVHAYKLLSTYGAKKTRTSKGFTPFLRRRFKRDLPELFPLSYTSQRTKWKTNQDNQATRVKRTTEQKFLHNQNRHFSN